ncbi:LytR/AlgR family response regulator transcription factor [Salinibacter altiplanensis]|uniref:LytR/AlgR family response regulator transcription factor n=1 Tax=Salinibacter altiplanensis TaxID=1803181 RepID=UPI000C9F480D|nr:response regulator transcription factor [Salinibacter altiplanensis]
MLTLDTLIVDDERLVRSELRRMLDGHDSVKVVGEATDATEAEAASQELGPDLLLLDVQMPGGSGFDLLERLGDVPHVVFVTAYDEHAIRAFEVNALDYLVKPVEEERLAEAIETVQEQAALAEAAASEKAASEESTSAESTSAESTSAEEAASVQKARGPAPQPDTDQSKPGESEDPGLLTAEDQVFVKDGRRCWFVRLGKVDLFEAAGNYTRLYFEGEEPLIHRSLSYLEERLDPDQYFRASRQHIFNLDRVDAMNSRPNGKLVAHLSEDLSVELSHRRSRAFREERSL